jgi:hypothetical protein
VQHVVGIHKDLNLYWAKDGKGHKRNDPVTVKSQKGRAIRHVPNKPSPAMSVGVDAKWMHWKDTDAARRLDSECTKRQLSRSFVSEKYRPKYRIVKLNK